MESLLSLAKEYVYKTAADNELKLVYLPPEEKKFEKAPLYIIIPGGGWRPKPGAAKRMISFSKLSVDILRQKGFAVVSIGYRNADGIVRIRDIIADCFDALGFVCKHSDELNIDTRRIVLSGHSAGGHLALMLAFANGNLFTQTYDFSNDFLQIKAVAALSPATVLHESGYPELIHFNPDHLFSNPDDLEERKLSSPLEYASSSCPPTVLFAGTQDTLIDYNSSVFLYQRLLEEKAEVKLFLSENGGHSFEQKEEGKEPSLSFEEIQKMTAEFLCQYI